VFVFVCIWIDVFLQVEQNAFFVFFFVLIPSQFLSHSQVTEMALTHLGDGQFPIHVSFDIDAIGMLSGWLNFNSF
jgi:hypothetical protein